MSSGDHAPHTWCLLGPKAGDNNQVLALAQALGWPFEQRQLHFRWHELLSNRLFRTALPALERRTSDPLRSPWPDLVITAGRRNEPVAQWIRRQNPERTRIVHIGRPWAQPAGFDLIVTTPQYFLPPADNVLLVPLPLHRMTPARLAQAGRQWQKRLAHLPRPAIAVLAGGDSSAYVLTPAKARRLGEQVNRMAARRQGSVWVSSSARTPAAAWAALLGCLQAPGHVFNWQNDPPAGNPYRAYLALADELVVTGESMSMLAEACATGKPVHIFDPGDDPARPWWCNPHQFRYKPLSHRLGMRLAPRRMRRDVGRIQQALVESGHAVWLGADAGSGRPAALPNSAELAAARVRALFK